MRPLDMLVFVSVLSNYLRYIGLQFENMQAGFQEDSRKRTNSMGKRHPDSSGNS